MSVRKLNMNFSRLAVCFALGLAVLATMPVGSAAAKGDLATKAKKIKLALGSKDSDYAMSQKQYRLETGQAYRWQIKSSGFKPYQLEAEEFFRNIWIRRIKVDDVELQVSVLHEVEFEETEESEIEIYFVPIRTGTYEFSFEGLEEKGMVGSFIVE